MGQNILFLCMTFNKTAFSMTEMYSENQIPPPPRDLLLFNMGCGCLSSDSSKVCFKDFILLMRDLCTMCSFSACLASGFTANFLNAWIIPQIFSQSLQIDHIGVVL